jgi:hypothetical protein
VRLVEFNFHPARYAHRSWFEDSRTGNQSVAAVIFDSSGCTAGRAEPLLSCRLLADLDLQAELDWEMREPQKSLWLLDRVSLERLALELAVSMHRDWLARVIDAARVRVLRELLGRELLRFVIEELPAGCFHYQEPLVSFEAEARAALGKDLTEHGSRTLMALLQPGWHAVRTRAQLHFDRALNLCGVPAFESTHCQRAIELIQGWLIPRRFPEWAWCF